MPSHVRGAAPEVKYLCHNRNIEGEISCAQKYYRATTNFPRPPLSFLLDACFDGFRPLLTITSYVQDIFFSSVIFFAQNITFHFKTYNPPKSTLSPSSQTANPNISVWMHKCFVITLIVSALIILCHIIIILLITEHSVSFSLL